MYKHVVMKPVIVLMSSVSVNMAYSNDLYHVKPIDFISVNNI